MSLVVLGLSHHTAPVTLRERFAFEEARVPATLQLLRESGLAEEVVILSTCNRVEMYVSTSLEPRQAFRELHEFLIKCHDYRDPLTDEILFGALEHGGTVTIGVAENGLTFAYETRHM